MILPQRRAVLKDRQRMATICDLGGTHSIQQEGNRDEGKRNESQRATRPGNTKVAVHCRSEKREPADVSAYILHETCG